jgi:hypothetical protein
LAQECGIMTEHIDPEKFFRSVDDGAADKTANGHDAEGGLRLVRYEAMEPRLNDAYLIKHLLGSTAMAVVYGDSGTGKTFLALYLSIGIAAGIERFGRRVRQAGVVYIAAEAGRGIENRVAAIKQQGELPQTIPFVAITEPVNLCTEAVDIERLISVVRHADLGLPVELIVIDTLSRVMGGGNENAPDDMGALVRNIDRLKGETGAAVLIVHHTGKQTDRGARGHSSLHAAIDTEIEITRDDATKIASARVTKQREYATDGLLSFSLRQVELGNDQDGDPVTSCILEPIEGVATPQRKPAKLTGSAKVGYDQLANCMADHAADIPFSSHVPKGAKGVTLDQWKGFLEKAGVINPEGNPREQFKRIRVTLQERGYVGVWDNFVWLSHAVTRPSQ